MNQKRLCSMAALVLGLLIGGVSSAEVKVKQIRSGLVSRDARTLTFKKKCARKCRRNIDRVNCTRRCMTRLKKRVSDRSCCKSPLARCLACEAKMTEIEYCNKRPETRGCPLPEAVPLVCCTEKIASCLACTQKIDIPRYCAQNPKTMGCDPKAPVCCAGLKAECIACNEGVTLQSLCLQRPLTEGCKQEPAPDK